MELWIPRINNECQLTRTGIVERLNAKAKVNYFCVICTRVNRYGNKGKSKREFVVITPLRRSGMARVFEGSHSFTWL